jgi:hypothetical protein
MDTDTEYKRDSAGRLVPLANVKPEHLLEEEMVLALFAEAERKSRELAEFKARAFEDIDAFLQLIAQKHNAKLRGVKGNMTLTSYDGVFRVTVAVGDQLTFGPELQIAKELVDECLTDWSEGGNPNILTIINDAFDVGKEGRLQVTKILALRRHDIKDPRWQRAMDAISEAVKVHSSSRYLRFHRKRGKEWVQVPLDIARL